MSCYSNPHAGHRQRMRDRFVREGLESFDDHQILELVLYYAIPRGDTNEIGHRLIKHFGRLSAVFDARISDLRQIPGVGEQAAVLIHALPALMRRYHSDRIVRDAPILNSAATVSQYL
jgi:DNA repair protein RadC